MRVCGVPRAQAHSPSGPQAPDGSLGEEGVMMMEGDTDIKLIMMVVGFVCWCIWWVVAVAIMIDDWTWRRKIRKEDAQ